MHLRSRSRISGVHLILSNGAESSGFTIAYAAFELPSGALGDRIAAAAC
mgnify:CR=1 FL=1